MVSDKLAIRRAKYAALPEEVRAEKQRRYGILAMGISVEQYDSMLESQDGKCASCGQPPKKNRLAIDHDHTCCAGLRSCGKCVRGLLCITCNMALGLLENAELQDQLHTYLANASGPSLTGCATVSAEK
jgi:hypothetical protein